MKYLIFIFALSVTFSVTLSASTPTNLEVISNSIDSLVNQNATLFSKKTIRVKSKYEPIKEKISSTLTNSDSTITTTDADSYDLLIELDSVNIVYYGNTKERNIVLLVSIFTIKEDMLTETLLPITITDTIDTDNIPSLENTSYPFTIGTLVEESSFWDDALEPVVYVGAAAVVIYLLFTVRSG